MSKRYLLGDDSVIEWIDKETLKYSENDFSVSIWVDFEPGFFNSGRIIKASSLEYWNRMPEGYSKLIAPNKKEEILAKVQDYYHSINIKCRIEL